MTDLFNTPVRSRKVRKGVIAYQYKNGVININGQKYQMYSMTEAIKKYRTDNPSITLEVIETMIDDYEKGT